MRRCIDSLLPGGDEVEILIIDDGSTEDDTALIADEYERRYPGVCRAIHQENGGHGEAVNTGLKNASGIYFKVVDSDDMLDFMPYMKVLGTLRRYADPDNTIDMFVCNFVYDKQGAFHKKVMNYRTAFPKDRVFTWDEVRSFHIGQYILMHSVFYRTQMLKDCGFSLPAHTFYVDNIFVYHPLPYVKKLYYMDTDLYRYYIGRDDQSVNEKTMISRIDQQYHITYLMLGYYDVTKIEGKKLRNYMISYLEIMMAICSILAIRSGTEENMAKKDKLWDDLKSMDPTLYKRLRYGPFGVFMNLPGKAGRMLTVAGYKVSQKIFGFN